MKSNFSHIGLAKLCGWFGITRQAYYQNNWDGISTTIEEDLVIQKVKESCDQYNSPDSLKGYGIPDFAQAYYTVTGKKITYPSSSFIDLVAPNPFKGFISVCYFAADTHFIEIQIFDMMGKEVVYKKQWCETRSYNKIDFQMPSGIAQGMYFLQINTKLEKTVLKLIKE